MAMKTKVIIMVQDTDDFSEHLSNVFYNYEGKLDDFVEFVCKSFPMAVCKEPVEEEGVTGDIMEQSDHYIMTYEEHNMGGTMRVYERQISREWTDRMLQLFGAINRSGIDNSQWGVCEDVGDTCSWFGTIGSYCLEGKWLYIYTDEDGDNPIDIERRSESVPEADREYNLRHDDEMPMINKSIVFYKLEE